MLVVAIIAMVVGAAGAWAAWTVLRPAPDPADGTEFTYSTVSAGEVGSDITLNAVARWTSTTVGTNRAVGIVTAVVLEPGTTANSGDVLYRVDERPVVVAEGAVPSYRAIGEGAKGPDVEQWQRMLSALGYLTGAVDGVAGPATTHATRAWQRAQGQDESGIVDAGSVVFVPELPARLSLDRSVVSRGSTLAGGEDVVSGLSSVPTFTIPATDVQARMMPSGTPVEITAPGGAVWSAVAGEQKSDDDTAAIDVALDGLDGAPICGEECGQVAVEGESLLSARVLVVPPVKGLVVPSAALMSTADGKVVVVDDDGERIPVEVIESARGISVIEGAAEGTRVRLPSTDGAGSP